MSMRTARHGQPCLVPYTLSPTAVSIAAQRVAYRRPIASPRTGQPRPGRSRGLSVIALKNYSSTVNEKGIVVGDGPIPRIQPSWFVLLRPPLLSALQCFAADRHRGRDAVQQDPMRQPGRDRSAGLPRWNRVRHSSTPAACRADLCCCGAARYRTFTLPAEMLVSWVHVDCRLTGVLSPSSIAHPLMPHN